MTQVYLVRGLPGSGKSTLARTLFGRSGHHIEADDFFLRNGVYRFDPQFLDMAHDACYGGFLLHAGRGKSVAVANTFTRISEMQRYIDACRRLGITYEIVEPTTPWAKDPDQCFARCVHNVPLAIIRRMVDRWETL